MTGEILFMLLLLGAALIAFVREMFPIEVTALAVLGVLLASGIIDAGQALTGFSNKAVVAIGGLFVMSHALFKSGIIETAADRLSRFGSQNQGLTTAGMLASVSVLSGFLNNTAVVAILIPLVLNVARRLEISPTKLLLPLSYAAIFGGTLTLIGTSTNLLVSSLAEELGQPAFGMFEFSSLGIIMIAIGLVYVLLVSPRVLPDRIAAGSLTSKYRMSDYLSEVRIDERSSLVGTTVDQAQINDRYDVTVLAILREKRKYIQELRKLKLKAGDVFMVRGSADSLVAFSGEEGLELLPEAALADEELTEGGQVIVEALVTRNSPMIGRSPKQLDFRRRLGGFVLAVGREGEALRKRLARVRLKFSDTLLILMPAERLDGLRSSDDLLVLSEDEFELRRRRFWWLPMILMPLVVVLAALGIMEIAAGALLGAILVLMSGLITAQDAYRAIDWSVLVMIAAFVPVGHAIVETGTAAFIAKGLLSVAVFFPESLAPYALVALLYLVTSIFTESVSNSASAIILTPVAIDMSTAVGADPRPFLMAICFAASASFMTPMGYQTNLMVYAPGGYKFIDYVRLGGPLNLAFWILASLLIPQIWPF